MKGVHNTKEVDSARNLDNMMINQLRDMAVTLDTLSLNAIADRFEKLADKAHNRLHWTGEE